MSVQDKKKLNKYEYMKQKENNFGKSDIGQHCHYLRLFEGILILRTSNVVIASFHRFP